MTTFEEKVYLEVKKIPKGKVDTYAGIAIKAGYPNAARAVGNALHKNPDHKNIPCHRVVGSNGNLTGYGGGIKNKVELLKHEGIDLSKYFIPKQGTAL